MVPTLQDANKRQKYDRESRAKFECNSIFIFEDIHESFILEGIVASILIILSSMGFLFLYQSSKHIYNKKMADTFLAIGGLVIIIGFVLLQNMLRVKMKLPLFES